MTLAALGTESRNEAVRTERVGGRSGRDDMRTVLTDPSRMKVRFVALQANEGLVLLK